MRVNEIADYVEAMIPSLRRFADNNDDMDLPDELVLTFVINFLTEPTLRALEQRRFKQSAPRDEDSDSGRKAPRMCDDPR